MWRIPTRPAGGPVEAKLFVVLALDDAGEVGASARLSDRRVYRPIGPRGKNGKSSTIGSAGGFITYLKPLCCNVFLTLGCRRDAADSGKISQKPARLLFREQRGIFAQRR